MSHQFPVDDPSDDRSLGDRTLEYVRGHPLLRALLALTIFDHLAAITLVLFGALPLEVAGLLGLLSVLTWFFGVGLPMINREVRHQLGAARVSYWGEVVEMFARVILCAQTGLYTAALTFYCLGLM